MKPVMVTGFSKKKPATIDSFFKRSVPQAAAVSGNKRERGTPPPVSASKRACPSLTTPNYSNAAHQQFGNKRERDTTTTPPVPVPVPLASKRAGPLPLTTTTTSANANVATKNVAAAGQKRKECNQDQSQGQGQGGDAKRSCIASADDAVVETAASSSRTAVGQRWVINDQYKVERYPAHPRNQHVKMDEDPHIYYLKGSCRFMTSVTTILGQYKGTFNNERSAKSVIKKSKYDPDYAQYAGMTLEQVLAKWDANSVVQSTYGTALHASIEQFYCDQKIDRSKLETETEWEYFMNFHREVVEKRGWKMYLAEWIVYAEELFLAGSVDAPFALSAGEPGKIVLIDWKRCKNLDDDAWKNPRTGRSKMMYDPCDSVEDVKKGHYAVQLNFYKWLFETYYGVEVVEMYIVGFHPHTQKDYLMIPVEPMPEVIAGIVADRRRQVAQLLAHEQQLMARERAARRVLVVGDCAWADGEHMAQHLEKLKSVREILLPSGDDTCSRPLVMAAASRCSSNHAVSLPKAVGGDSVDDAERYLKQHKPDMVLAFHDDLTESTHTRAMVDAAKKLDVLVVVVTHADAQYSQA